MKTTRPAHIPAPPKGYVYLGRWEDIVKPAGWSAARCPNTDYCDFAYSSGGNWDKMVDGYSSGYSNFHFAALPNSRLYNLNAKKTTIAPKVKTDTDLLKDRIEALEKENAELKTWKAKVVAAVGA